MKFFKLVWLTFLLVVLCFVLSGIPRTNAEQEKDRNLCFRWAFGAIESSGHELEFSAITRDTTLKTGDKLKMLVELKNKCFVYVIYHSAQGEMSMLFPYDTQQFTRDYQTAKKYYIPQGNRWFELDDNVGSETFYLFVSAQRLIKLEAFFSKYTAADPVKKQDLAKQILTEIRKIKRYHRKLTTFAERPVPIGGSVRGSTKDEKAPLPDIATIAVEISADNFFSRTFTIDHR
jgi:hypothetical protein